MNQLAVMMFGRLFYIPKNLGKSFISPELKSFAPPCENDDVTHRAVCIFGS